MFIGLIIQICVGQNIFHQAYGKSGSGSDLGYSVKTTNDGGYIITGEYDVSGLFSAQVYLVKIDSLGNLTWTKTFGGEKEVRTANGTGNRGYGVLQTYDGGYIIGGEVHSFSAGMADMYLIKTNPSGDIVWSKSYGGNLDDYCYSIQETTDSCFILAGSTESFGLGIRNVYLIKVSSIGDTLWTKTFGDSTLAGAFDVRETLDKGFIITGYTFSTIGGDADIFLIKTNTNGNIIWQKAYGGNKNEYGYSVTQTADEGYIITGSTESYGEGNQDVFLIKTDSLGNLQWSNSYGGASFEEGNSVIQLHNRGFLIVGYTRSFGAGWEDVYVIRTDSLGVMMWSKVYGGLNGEIGKDIKLCGDDGYIITGGTRSFGVGNYNLYAIKIDSMGESGCHQLNSATIMNSDTTSVSLLTFEAGHGAIITDPPTIVGNTSTEQLNICDSALVINELNHQSIKIFPSPVSDFLQIGNSFNADVEIIIYNAMGQAIHTTFIKANSQDVIDLSGCSKGLHYITVLKQEMKIIKKVLVVD